MKTTRLSIFLSLTIFLTSLNLLVATAAQAQVPSYVPTNGLVGYWPFNGNANDESGNGNNGTVNGATLTADRFGDIGKAYSFNGTSNFIDCGPLGAIPGAVGDITQSAWVLAASDQAPYCKMAILSRRQSLSDGWPTIGGGANGAQGFPVNNQAYFFLNAQDYGNGVANALHSTSLTNDGTWHLITGVKTGPLYELFFDGVLQSTMNDSYTLISNSNLIIGHEAMWGFDCERWYAGKLDEIGIWNRALTADEVLVLYNGCNVAPLAVSGNVTPTQFTQETYTYPNTVGSTYNWTVTNGVIVSGQGTNSVTILWGAEGVESVFVSETTADGCVGDEVIYDVDVQCVVSGNEITGPVGPEAFSNLTYTCNGAANSTYNWTVTNGVIASGQGTNTVDILWASTGLGNVSVVETTAEGCVGTTLSQDVVVIPTSVEELSNAMILYPNPVTTNLTLQVKSEMIGSDFVVFDALGKVVLRDKILSSNQNISVINLSNGNYILRVGEMKEVFTISK